MSRLCGFHIILRFFHKKPEYLRIIILAVAFISSLVIPADIAFANKTHLKNGLNSQPVYIYYFYFTPRCDECLIVEKALVKVLDDYYSEELRSKQLIYKTINLTDPDPESKKIAQELRVRRQLLLLVSGDTIVNMTRDAFRYAETRYELFRDSMKNAIDQILSH
jgi:hypothetical protein